ncbi:hypothetical protein [Clostridium celatum]|uniref:hypothetical protein n=1 Tax=Clostridium celatum TaxID=36834 RepID=UPI00189786F4|nr:hypothetical protein [Clostridium celatum]
MKDMKTTLGDLRLTKENYNEIELILNQYIQIYGEISLNVRNETVLSEHKKIKEIRIYEFNNFLRLELKRSSTDIEKIHLYGDIIDYGIQHYIPAICESSQECKVVFSTI